MFKPRTTTDFAKQTNQFKQSTKWNLPHTKPGLNSWIGAKASMNKRLEDRLQKYGGVNEDGTIDVKRIGVNRFAPVLTDGTVD